MVGALLPASDADPGAAAREDDVVAHVLPWRNVGGTEIATLRLIRALREHRYRSIACHLPGADPVRRLFEDEGVLTLEIDEVRPSYRSAFRYVAHSWSLAGTLRQYGACALHCSDIRGAFLTALAGKLARIPVLSHVRNRYREVPFPYRALLRQVDHFVFVSQQTWTEFGHRVKPRRGSVLYDGVAEPDRSSEQGGIELRRSLGIPEDAPIAGMVARVARQKDYETLIRAASMVVEEVPQVRFVIVGDHEEPPHREYYRELQALLEETGLRDRFVFTGHREEVGAFLEIFDVFVLSTHWEGLPLVILEAMAHGLPVVATAVDGVPEVVEPGETGLLHRQGDPVELADALLRLLHNEGDRRRIGAAARSRITNEFSEDAYRARVGELYARVLRPDQCSRSATAQA